MLRAPGRLVSLVASLVACSGEAPEFPGANSGSGGDDAGATSDSTSTPTSTGNAGTGSSSAGTGGNGGGSGSSGTGGASTGSTGGGGEGGAPVCGSVVFGDPVPATVVLTLDASGSMAGGDGFPEKWTPTIAAIEDVVDIAPQDLRVGLVPFPAGEFDSDALATACGNLSSPECAALLADGGCEDVAERPAIPIAPLPESGPAIVSWMTERQPDGGTPTYWALRRSYEVAATAQGTGARFVLLVTDGEPNVHQPEQSTSGFTIPEANVECRDLEAIEAEVAAAAAAEPPVRTFVVGAPGSEVALQFMSRLAVAGETSPAGCSTSSGECHVQIGAPDYAADLAIALADIAGKAAGCRLEIALEEAADPEQLVVVVEASGGDVDVPRDATRSDGWDVVQGDPLTIELFGPPCELYRDAASNQVRVEVTCPD